VKLFLAFHSSIEFDDTSYGNSHTVSILSVGDIKCRGTTLDLAGEERKIYPRYSYEIGKKLRPGLTHERLELIQLFLRERRSPESYRVVGLWTSFIKRERECTVPAFISYFIEMIKVRGAIGGQRLGGRDDQQTDIPNDYSLVPIL